MLVDTRIVVTRQSALVADLKLGCGLLLLFLAFGQLSFECLSRVGLVHVSLLVD